MYWLKIFSVNSLGKKLLLTMSGTALSLFLLMHLAGNIQALSGREAFLGHAEWLHGLGVGLHIMEVFLMLAFLLHTVLGLALFLENRRARTKRYAVANREPSLLARLMPYTGLFILLFILIHLKQFLYSSGNQNQADLLCGTLSRPDMSILYLSALAMLCMHTTHGFRSMLLTFGLDHHKYNRLLQAGALIASIGIGLGFALLPLSAFFLKGFLV